MSRTSYREDFLLKFKLSITIVVGTYTWCHGPIHICFPSISRFKALYHAIRDLLYLKRTATLFQYQPSNKPVMNRFILIPGQNNMINWLNYGNKIKNSPNNLHCRNSQTINQRVTYSHEKICTQPNTKPTDSLSFGTRLSSIPSQKYEFTINPHYWIKNYLICVLEGAFQRIMQPLVTTLLLLISFCGHMSRKRYIALVFDM